MPVRRGCSRLRGCTTVRLDACHGTTGQGISRPPSATDSGIKAQCQSGSERTPLAGAAEVASFGVDDTSPSGFVPQRREEARKRGELGVRERERAARYAPVPLRGGECASDWDRCAPSGLRLRRTLPRKGPMGPGTPLVVMISRQKVESLTRAQSPSFLLSSSSRIHFPQQACSGTSSSMSFASVFDRPVEEPDSLTGTRSGSFESL